MSSTPQLTPLARKRLLHPSSHALLCANLRALYACATEPERIDGLAWYPNARAIVRAWSLHYGYSADVIANVLAVCSPQLSWTRNVIVADDIIAGRPPSIGMLQANRIKAERCRDDNFGSDLAARVPYGLKVQSFAANLKGYCNVVTVDTHALQAALGNPEVSCGLKRSAYIAFARAYLAVAAEVSLNPCDFQAIIWLVWRRLYAPETKRAILRASARKRSHRRT